MDGLETDSYDSKNRFEKGLDRGGVDTDQTTGLKEHTEGNEEVERKIQEYTSREESHHE